MCVCVCVWCISRRPPRISATRPRTIGERLGEVKLGQDANAGLERVDALDRLAEQRDLGIVQCLLDARRGEAE